MEILLVGRLSSEIVALLTRSLPTSGETEALLVSCEIAAFFTLAPNRSSIAFKSVSVNPEAADCESLGVK
jgi:hypothetical protein